MPKPTVFLSYSHEDEKSKDELRDQLAVMEELLAVWDDRQIDGGDTWWDKIRAAIDGAEVAVCLISADYLNSDFCKKEEIPYLLKRRSEQGMRLLSVLLRPCPYQYVSWLKAVDLLPRDRRPIATYPATKREQALSEIAESIAQLLAAGGEEAVRSPVRGAETGSIFRSLPMSPGSYDLEMLGPSLPAGGDAFFGRDGELQWLDEIWTAGTVRIVSLTGPAGIGKSALANAWRERIERENACSIEIRDDADSLPVLSLRADRQLLLLISRKPLPELDSLPQDLVARKELGPLSPSAGRALLRVNGVRGTDAELEAISRELGGIPAALVRRAERGPEATSPSPPSA